jgi:hypothetical protein
LLFRVVGVDLVPTFGLVIQIPVEFVGHRSVTVCVFLVPAALATLLDIGVSFQDEVHWWFARSFVSHPLHLLTQSAFDGEVEPGATQLDNPLN